MKLGYGEWTINFTMMEFAVSMERGLPYGLGQKPRISVVFRPPGVQFCLTAKVAENRNFRPFCHDFTGKFGKNGLKHESGFCVVVAVSSGSDTK